MSNIRFGELHKQLHYIRAIGKVVDEDWQKGAKKLGITQSEHHILCILFFEKKAPMSRIAEIGLWDLSTVMQIIKRLKAKKLVEIIKDEKDLRISYVQLTDQGLDVRDKSMEIEMRTAEFLEYYQAKNEENRCFLEKLEKFQQEISKYFYGAEFVEWVESNGKKI